LIIVSLFNQGPDNNLFAIYNTNDFYRYNLYDKKWTSLRLKDVYPDLEEGFTGGVLDNYNRNWFFKSKSF